MSRFTSDTRIQNHSQNEPLLSVIDRYLSRREMLKGSLGVAALGLLGGLGGLPRSAEAGELRLGFESIPGQRLDALAVATGYSAQVLAPWGTPLNAQGKPWRNDGSNSAADQLNAVGMHHDGMHFFPLDGRSDEGLMAVNFEYIDQKALHPNGATRVDGKRPAEEVCKEINAHGLGILHIRRQRGVWSVVPDSRYNRRLTSASVIDIAGPLRGSEHLVTAFAPDGQRTRGTNNNCGNGYTPWGTYLSCEENWPIIFRNGGELPIDQQRIGITGTSSYGWESAAGAADEQDDEFARFDLTPRADSAREDYRNEASGFGYIVEIDPFAPERRAVKRTALGRFRHEGCWPGRVEAGQPVVFYMGDDSKFEYLYKFVSAALWDPADAKPQDPLATGAKYMDAGTLYVARFDAEGQGVWLPLTPDAKTRDGSPLSAHYADLATLLLNTRGAADAVGATPMDRPEWTTVDPLSGDGYVTLTNNDERKQANVANPRANNPNGHILRWREQGDARFAWEIFVFGSDAAGQENRSGLSEHNQFASPDGMTFDSRGILWFETDNSGNAVAEYTNDQLLAVIPAQLHSEPGQASVIGAGNQEQLRRFLVGPNGCEVTGITFTPDNSAMFVNIQHPGNWPSYDSLDATRQTNGKVRPRACTVVIQKIDGGPIGV